MFYFIREPKLRLIRHWSVKHGSMNVIMNDLASEPSHVNNYRHLMRQAEGIDIDWLWTQKYIFYIISTAQHNVYIFTQKSL